MTREVKRQVENAPTVKARRIGKEVKEKPNLAQYNDLFVENAVQVLVKNHIKNISYLTIANYAR